MSVTLPFVSSSSTSRAEAERQLATGTMPSKRTLVLEAIRAAGSRGMTDKELQRLLNMGGSTQRPRRVELVERGLIVDSGAVRERSAVWVDVRWATATGTQLRWV